jgi:transcriptional regulator with XRE-family HTH domain
MKYRVKEICKSKGLRMEDLAQKLGITQSALSHSLLRNTTIDNLERIADVLQVSVADLFEMPQSDNFSPALVCPHCGKPLCIAAS